MSMMKIKTAFACTYLSQETIFLLTDIVGYFKNKGPYDETCNLVYFQLVTVYKDMVQERDKFKVCVNIFMAGLFILVRGGSRISGEGIQMWKTGVCLHNFTQNVLNSP